MWLKDMPGFDDWVEMQKPEMTEEKARSYGEVHANIRGSPKVNRQDTFATCDFMVKAFREQAERERKAGRTDWQDHPDTVPRRARPGGSKGS